MFLGAHVQRGEALVTCLLLGSNSTAPIMKPSDMPYPTEVPLSSIEVCADGKSIIDHIAEFASMTKNLIISYEQKLANLNVKRNYYKALLGITRRIEKHNRHIVETTIKENDDLLSYLVETYEEQDDLILHQLESTINALTNENNRL